MEKEKCFCHLNGYKVKDSDAQSKINDIETRVGYLEEGNVLNFHQHDAYDGELETMRENITTAEYAGIKAQEAINLHIQQHENGQFDSDKDYEDWINNNAQEISAVNGRVNTLEQQFINLDEFDTRLSDRITALEDNGGGGGGLELYAHVIVFEEGQRIIAITHNSNSYNENTIGNLIYEAIRIIDGDGNLVTGLHGSYDTMNFGIVFSTGMVQEEFVSKNNFTDTVYPFLEFADIKPV